MSGSPNWLETHGNFINTVMEFAPKEYVGCLDNCRKLLNPTIENIQASLPEGWSAVQHRNRISLQERFEYLRKKMLPISLDQDFQTDVLGFVPLTHYIGGFLTELRYSMYHVKLFTLVVELGMLFESEELKAFGSHLLTHPDDLEVILETEYKHPASKQIVNQMEFIRFGETSRPNMVVCLESKNQIYDLL